MEASHSILPDDIDALRAIIAAQADQLAEQARKLQSRDTLIDKLKAQLAVLKRARCQCRVNFPQLCRGKIPQLCRRGRQGELRIFRRAAARLLRWSEGRRCNEGFGADMLRHEFGVLTQPIAGSFDLNDNGVVK